MFDLGGKHALVTGATGGIGEAIARTLVAQGAKVAVSGTRAEKLDALVGSLGAQAVPVPCNLSDADAVAGLAGAAEEALGAPVDILVNNAGITRDQLAMRMKDEEWDEVLQVNLRAAFKLCQGVMRGMMKARWGRIISISSVVGATGNPGQANYAASKAGLVGMSKALAQELAARNITVNVVAPGFIATPMTDELPDAQKEALLGRIPVGALGSAEDIASAVAYLASNEAAYVTGETLHVNGGMAML